MRTLDGITVVSLEQAIAAPFCTRQLGDLGARVIKIERPGTGDFCRAYDERVRGMASHFVWTNRSKESLTLDVKHEQAGPILRALIERADVLVQNLAPGAAARLGLDWGAVHELKPRLILCDISGYGPEGPYRDKKAYDLLIQCESGVVALTGTPEAPAKTGASIADISAGMYGLSGVLAALIRRSATGLGSHVEISMFECMTEWTSYALYYTFDGAPPPERAGAAHAAIYPYGPFVAGDGKVVVLGLQNEREWAVFCEKVLRRPELAADPRFEGNPRRVAAREEIRAMVNAAFSRLSLEQVVRCLDDAGIANARMNDMADVWAHPQLQARGRWTEVDTPVGKIPALLPPGMSAADDPRMDSVPALGQHTDAILAELGYGPAEVAALHADGVV